MIGMLYRICLYILFSTAGYRQDDDMLLLAMEEWA